MLLHCKKHCAYGHPPTNDKCKALVNWDSNKLCYCSFWMMSLGLPSSLSAVSKCVTVMFQWNTLSIIFYIQFNCCTIRLLISNWSEKVEIKSLHWCKPTGGSPDQEAVLKEFSWSWSSLILKTILVIQLKDIKMVYSKPQNTRIMQACIILNALDTSFISFMWLIR